MSSLLAPLAALAAGCDVGSYCDENLAILYVETFYSTPMARRLTAEEEADVRAILRRCRSVREEFTVFTPVVGDGPAATASVILLAAELNDAAILDELVSEGHPFDGLPNSEGTTTLHVAAVKGLGNTLSWALQQGVAVDVADASGRTPLMMTTWLTQDAVDGTQRLVSAGAQLDVVDEIGRSALTYALIAESNENAALLISLGADPAIARQGILNDIAYWEELASPVAQSRREALAAFDETYGHLLTE